jgi:S1-C subfamily serine protease
METCFDLPWQRRRPQKGSGSGVYLGDHQILTGAHVIQGATFIQVQKLTSPEKVIAKVTSICHDADLALLSVQDEEFLSDLEPASIGDLPELKDRVEVVGFPTGGEQVSITNGVVSRIEVNFYTQSLRSLLCATIDAAINPGNSGGFVFNAQGEVVGIAFQKNSHAENSGQMIPTPIIKPFLKSAREGAKRVNVPSLGVVTQTLENPTLKRHFKVPDDASGVLITSVTFESSVWGILEPGDILHQIGDYPVSSMGTVSYRKRYRTKISAILSECSEGDSIRLIRRRDGELGEVDVILKRHTQLAPQGEDTTNSYYVYGGLVFQPLTRKYLQTWKSIHHTPPALRYYSTQQLRTEALQQPVVITQILSDEVNVGYEDFYYQLVKEVNGTPIRDLDHLAELLDQEEDRAQIQTLNNKWIMIDAQLARRRHAEILERYQIPEDRRYVLGGSGASDPVSS